MVQNTAFAYLLILFLSPIPNVTIVSYINKKPLLTKVVLDHHHKDMIFINWAMSTILICWMIFINLPGYHNYGLETRTLLVELVRKGIGLFILALLTSFLISAGVHYLQKFHWTWLCEHDDENFIFVLRCINGVITIILWISWISLPSTILYQTIEITLVQIYAGICLAFFVIIHLAIEVRNYVHKRHIRSIYKNVTQENVDVGKGGVFADRSVGLASALIATTVVLFVVSSESPRSIRGPTFLFVLTISIICPTIFIIGSKKMRQSTISNVKQKISDAFDKTKMGFRKMFHRNRVGIEPNDEPGIDKC